MAVEAANSRTVDPTASDRAARCTIEREDAPMQIASLPANEEERLQVLDEYRILDTEPEADFDGLTELAAQVIGVPIALISIVDRDRQWFKSRHGLDATETPRDVAFCSHVVSLDHELVVSDAQCDGRFADNPLVLGEPRVRFYAGVPLRADNGMVLGTLCAIDRVPRVLSEHQLHLLRVLTRQVTVQLELRRRNLSLLDNDRTQRGLQVSLQASVREKEVLLREVHHRVKNNLQLVSSLINLQLSAVESDEARTALEECQGRIHAVAMVHEAIYSARDYAQVSISQYARGLASSVFHALAAPPRGVSLEVDVGDFQLAVDRAIPCGLILNELLTNALKHAYPNGGTGTVRLIVEELPDGKLSVVVSDDGVGLPPDFDLEASSSVGLQVVGALVEQLDGTFSVSREGGTRFALTFAGQH
jgi:two-component sensor histidine kinase